MAAVQVAHDILQHLENMGSAKQTRHKQLSYNNLLRQFQLRVTKPKHGEAWCCRSLCFLISSNARPAQPLQAVCHELWLLHKHVTAL